MQPLFHSEKMNALDWRSSSPSFVRSSAPFFWQTDRQQMDKLTCHSTAFVSHQLVSLLFLSSHSFQQTFLQRFIECLDQISLCAHWWVSPFMSVWAALKKMLPSCSQMYQNKKRLLLKEACTKDGCNKRRQRFGQNMSLKCCALDQETQHVTKESLKTKSPGLHTNRLKAAACSGKDSVVEDT